jgi:hypothetical protein
MGADHKCGRRGNWVPVAVLRCKQIIRPERLCSKGTKAKRQSPVRGSAVYRLVSGFYFYCLIFRSSAVNPCTELQKAFEDESCLVF